MANHNHPTPEQRVALRSMVDACGAVEVLRLLGQIIANDEPDLHLGTAIRTSLLRAAKELEASAYFRSLKSE